MYDHAHFNSNTAVTMIGWLVYFKSTASSSAPFVEHQLLKKKSKLGVISDLLIIFLHEDSSIRLSQTDLPPDQLHQNRTFHLMGKTRSDSTHTQ